MASSSSPSALQAAIPMMSVLPVVGPLAVAQLRLPSPTTMRTLFVAAAAAAAGILAPVVAQTNSSVCVMHPEFPWCDTSKSFEERAAVLVANLTLDEVINLTATYFPTSYTPGVPRILFPAYSWHSEGLHGIRNSFDTMGYNSTLFPQVTGMVATGNVSLLAEMGAIMAVEARALNNAAQQAGRLFSRGAGLTYWSPTMNIARDPRWGRMQETLAPEDPFLGGLMSSVVVAALQGMDPSGRGLLQLGATCKHMVAYSLEDSDGFTRFTFNAVVSRADLNATYLPTFHACVTHGNPAQIMCSYNEVEVVATYSDASSSSSTASSAATVELRGGLRKVKGVRSDGGIPACLDASLMQGTLREAWNWTDGLIVSDCDAIDNAFSTHHYSPSLAAAAGSGINAGCDQDCGLVYSTSLAAAVAQGLTTETAIRQALVRSMTVLFRTGLLDPPALVPWVTIPVSELDSPAHRDAALRAARESIVLVQNRAGVLPLSAADLNNRAAMIAVVGPLANSTEVMRGAKQDYDSSFIITHLEGITSLMSQVAPAARVTFAQGCAVNKSIPGGFAQVQGVVATADIVVAVMGIDMSIEAEMHDRTFIGLPQVQQQLQTTIADAMKPGARLIVVLVHGGSLSADWSLVKADAVVDAIDGGQSGGQALAEVLLGITNPSGMAPYTVYPPSYVAQVAMTNMSMLAGPGRSYRYYTGQPLWPFGHSLSYTNWSIVWSQLPPATAPTSSANMLTMQVTVTNTGTVAGAKVILAFVSLATPSDGQPLSPYTARKSLFGVDKVFLQPGQATTVTFSTRTPLSPESRRLPSRGGQVPSDDMARGWCTFCDVAADGSRWVRPGAYILSVGGTGAVDSSPWASLGSGALPQVAANVTLTGDRIEVPML